MADLTGQKPLGLDNSFNLNYQYSFINNNQFYPLVPQQYYNYYNRLIRQYFYWYDGFVPHVHNNQTGMFSTNLANSICKRLAEYTMGGTLMYNYKTKPSKRKVNGKNSLEFINEWTEENDFSNLLSQSVEYAFAGGDSLLLLNFDGKHLWIDTYRKDSYYLDTDFRGNVTNIDILMYTMTKTVPNVNGEERKDTYYLLQKRYYENDEPYVEYYIKRTQGMITNNKSVDIRPETVDWDSVPKKIREEIKKVFGKGFKVETPIKIPLDNLGAYMLKTRKALSHIPSSPFGESELKNLTSELLTYDYLYSAMNTDIYTGRAHVMIPQTYTLGPLGENQGDGGNYNRGLDSYLYQTVEYVDPQSQKPTAIQFDLRADDWQKTSDNIIKKVALKIGVDVTVLDNTLDNGSNVKAQEIHHNNSKTVLYVENRRSIIKPIINQVLKDVAQFYGYKDKELIVVKFSKAGLTNMNNVVEIVGQLTDRGLIDDKTAMQMVFVDMDDAQIEDMLEKRKNNIKFQMENNTDAPNTDNRAKVKKPKEEPKKGLIEKVKDKFKK